MLLLVPKMGRLFRRCAIYPATHSVIGPGSLSPLAFLLWSQSWYSVPGVKVMVLGMVTDRVPKSPVASCSGAPPGARRQATRRVAPSGIAVVERVWVPGVQRESAG